MLLLQLAHVAGPFIGLQDRGGIFAHACVAGWPDCT